MQRIGRNAGMNIVGAVGSFLWNMACGRGGLDRSAAGSGAFARLAVLRVQFALGLQPMFGLAALRPAGAGFLPNLVGPLRNRFDD